MQTETETETDIESEMETETLGILEMFVTVACSSLKQLQLNDQRSSYVYRESERNCCSF